MSATYVNDGRRILYTNTSSAISAGDPVVIVSGTSGITGVAVVDIAATTGTGQVEIAGRFTFVKANSEAITQGQVLYWDGTEATGTSTSTYTRCGRAAVAAATAATSVDVLLNVY